MRRVLVLLLAGVVLLTACSGGSGDGAGGAENRDLSDIEVSGQLGDEARVSGVKGFSTDEIVTRTVAKGDGPELANGQTVNLRYTLYNAADGKALTSTYESGDTVPLELDRKNDKLLSGSIVGHKIGARVLIAGPATEFYGKQGATQAGVETDETLVLVAELASKYKPPKPTGTIDDVGVDGAFGKKPKIQVKDNLVVAETQSKVLEKGDGAEVSKGDSVQVHYVGVNARNGKEFDSSYKRGKPATFALNPTQVVPGFVKGLSGQSIGSRVLVTIPAVDGYGPAGNPQAGIKGGDSLVFVIDLVNKGGNRGDSGGSG